jgi:hypothetical protein
MAEQVRPRHLTVSWQPNAPDAVSTDLGVTCLAVRADIDDPQSGRWAGVPLMTILRLG